MTGQTVAAARTNEARPGELAGSLRLFERSLKAANRAESTLYKYVLSATQLIDFLERAGMPTTATGVRREHIEAFVVHATVRQGRPNTPRESCRSGHHSPSRRGPAAMRASASVLVL
jgi:hypothetical protein